MRPSLEVADILRRHGEALRRAHAGHLSLGQLSVMSAIEACRTAELGGHVARCDGCERLAVSYNSLYGDFVVKLELFHLLRGLHPGPVQAIRGEPAIGRVASRRNLVFGWVLKGPGP